MYEGSVTLQLAQADRWAIKDLFGRWEVDASGVEVYLTSAFAINDKTFGNKGIQGQYNDGSPRFYCGDGSTYFIQFDGTNTSWAGTNTSLTDGGKLTAEEIDCRGIFRAATFETDTISAIGGSFLVSKGADVLATTMTALDSCNLVIEGNETFAVGDILRIKDGTDDEWFEVTNVASAPTYVVTRDKAGSYGADSNPTWAKGASVVNYGASGDGVIQLTASETHAPFIQVDTHAGAPWTTLTTRMRMGNLNGYLGYSSDLYGVGIGDTNNYVKYDPTNGLTLQVTAANAITIKAGGDIRLESAASNPGEIIFAGTSYTTRFGGWTANGDTIRLEPDTTNVVDLYFGYTSGNLFEDIVLAAYDSVVLFSQNDADNSALLGTYASATDNYVQLAVETNGSTELLIAKYEDGGSLYFSPVSDKSWDLARAAAAFDDAYADDWNNVADFFLLDDRDDLDVLHKIKGSGLKDSRTGLELIDDNTLPMFLLTKSKDGKSILYNPENKPYISLKTIISLLMGAVKQLDLKVENLIVN